MAENDAPKQFEDEEKEPLSFPSHTPLPPPPEVPYTRPPIGQKSSPVSGSSVGHSSGWEESSQAASHGAGLAAGLTFVTSIIGGALLGNWIDLRWNHTGMPWATLILTLIGAAAGFLNLQRLTVRTNRKSKK